MAELHCVGDALALGVRVDKLKAPIQVQGGSNVKSMLCLKVPRPPCDRFGMDEDPPRLPITAVISGILSIPVTVTLF